MFLQTKLEKGKLLCFFNTQGCSFLIATYILHPGLYLGNKGNHQI